MTRIGYRPGMPAPFLDHVRTVCDAVVESVRSSDVPQLQYVFGEQSVGKSALLHMLPDALARMDSSLKVILVSAPTGAADAAAVAAVRLTGELWKAGVVSTDDAYTLTQPAVAWNDKLELLRNALEHHSGVDRVVLLIDDPRTWRPTVGGPFTEHVEQLSGLLVDTVRTTRVVTTSRLPSRGAHRHIHRIEAGGDHAAWLMDERRWSVMAHSAKSLLSVEGHDLASMTPLQVRLATTLHHLGETETARALVQGPVSMTALCTAVAEVVMAIGGALQKVVQQLLFVRGAIDDSLLEALGAPAAGTAEGTVLRSGLLYGSEGQYEFSDAVRHALSVRLIETDVERQGELHRFLKQHYVRQADVADARGDLGKQFSCQVEAFWHAASAGDENVDEIHPYAFALQALWYGTLMHQKHARPDIADAVFSRQLERDEDDAYALHNRAFARDRIAQDPDGVEDGYRSALRLDDGNVRWHARYITFLVDQGAIGEARTAWFQALSAPLNADERAESVVEQLHRPVLARLVRGGELSFAEEVVAKLTREQIRSDPALVALVVRLTAMLEASRVGPVRPYRLLQPNWWCEGPTVPQSLPGDLRLIRWWAARVVEVTDEGLSLQYAEVEGTEDPRPGSTVVSRDAYASAIHDAPIDEHRAGQFLEIGFYRNGTADVAKVLVQQVRTAPTLDDLPPSELPPQRYLHVVGRTDAQ